ncbi:Cmx/CmrA family chloramphenicol efflux MFS transporter [Kitasatospora sp. NPDC058115]|uniref:Cmx/CmrA family chloramphenicol efflux MFS transporter n=1 Tax=Kitasatospora sp. NPDC058115 TaxID=3346347 RepID=UPI0036DA55C7
MPLPLYLLALAVFAMGTSEFMLAGLLPAIAPELGVTVGAAGTLTSAYAIGMVVGAPLTAVLARALPGRRALLGSLLLFTAAHAAGAAAPNLPVLLATRVVAALANAGFLAVALTTAAALVPADRKGRALAVLLSGTTVATVAGVPAGAALGAALGWRAVFLAVAALCLPAALGVLTGVPAGRTAQDATERPSVRAEFAELGKPRPMAVMLLAALVNAATFAGFTYLAPVVTGTAGLDGSWVPVALVLFGAGSFTGVTVAGRLSDRRPGSVLAAGGALLLIGWPAMAVLAHRPAALLALVFALGALSFAVGSTLITRVLYEAAAAPTLAGAGATAALNVGAAAGPLGGAGALGTAAGDLGPFWLSGLLVLCALLLAAPLHPVLRGEGRDRSEKLGRSEQRRRGDRRDRGDGRTGVPG